MTATKSGTKSEPEVTPSASPMMTECRAMLASESATAESALARSAGVAGGAMRPAHSSSLQAGCCAHSPASAAASAAAAAASAASKRASMAEVVRHSAACRRRMTATQMRKANEG